VPVAADVTVGDLPVRHTGLTPAGIEGLQESSTAQNIKAQQVRQISQEELEDRFLHAHDDHNLLKKHANEQEEKIKR
uniref:Uncharacterized protein n=1 Tax=Taeniopygia guttata TaxID=59729 RepID=A0A674H1R8_TAEGU